MTRSLAFALVLSAVSALAAGQPNPYLSQAKVFYQGLEYEKCLTRLDQATKWNSGLNEEVEVQLYFGLCNFNMGNADEAKRRFELALKLDGNLQLPPYTSPRIAELFETSRKRIAARARPVEDKPLVVDSKKPPPVDEKEKEKKVAAADVPTKVELTPAPSASTEQKPEFVEQSDGPNLVLPLALGGTAALAAGAGAFLGLQAKSAETEANTARFESDAFAASNRASSNAMLANVAFAVAGGALIGAVVTYFVTN